MRKMKLILASKSPRRQELIKNLGFPFEVRIKEIEEIYPSSLIPEEVPVYLAELKSSPFIENLASDELLITSDTVVIAENRILGKPTDSLEAFEMIKSLSGKQHKVVTGVCLSTQEKMSSFAGTTIVHFSELSDAEINYYIETYKPFDKAGAYGIQEWIGLIGISSIEGCFYNVMGLPVNAIYSKLKKEFGMSI